MRGVTLWQRYNQIVGAGYHRRAQDVILAGFFFEATDIVGYGAVEQGNVLRQIADISAKYVAIPLIEPGPIQTNMPLECRPNAHDRLCQRGFSRATCA